MYLHTSNMLLLLPPALPRSVNLQRYVCWMHTTPAVMYLIKSVSNSITTQQVGPQATPARPWQASKHTGSSSSSGAASRSPLGFCSAAATL
jgi:hypothetical protein